VNRLAFLGALAALAVAGCGSGESRPAAPRPPAPRTAAVDIAGFMYRPAKLEVAAGARVTWTNRDSSPHTATAAGTLDTGTLHQGQRRTLRLTKPGTYAYVCELHPFMKGSIVVRREDAGS
jgi:plastocyanin